MTEIIESREELIIDKKTFEKLRPSQKMSILYENQLETIRLLKKNRLQQIINSVVLGAVSFITIILVKIHIK